MRNCIVGTTIEEGDEFKALEAQRFSTSVQVPVSIGGTLIWFESCTTPGKLRQLADDIEASLDALLESEREAKNVAYAAKRGV